MSQETRGRDSARWVKVVSALMMIGGVIGGMATQSVGFGLLGLAGFFGFVIGRFMD